MKTPEISVLEAQKDIHCFAERIQRMFGMVKTLLGETNEEDVYKRQPLGASRAGRLV